MICLSMGLATLQMLNCYTLWQGYIENILYQRDVGSLECCEIKDGKVPVVSKILQFFDQFGQCDS